MFPETQKQDSPTGTIFDEIYSYWTEIAEAHETEKQANFARQCLDAKGLILDLGCGSGRHAVLLSKDGYNIVGLDFSLRLLKVANLKAVKAGVELSLVCGDMRFLPFRAGVFSGTISLDSTFGYFSSRNEETQSLKEVARTLADSGVFVIDVFNGDNMKKRKGRFKLKMFFFWLARLPQFFALFKWHEYPNFYLLQKRQITKNGNLLQDIWIIRDKQTRKTLTVRHTVRLYSLAQLRKMVDETKMKVTNVYGDYEKQVFNTNSIRLIMTASKTE